MKLTILMKRYLKTRNEKANKNDVNKISIIVG